MSVEQLVTFVKEALKRVVLIMLALILVMFVASRNVEFELEKQATQQQTQVEEGYRFP